MNLIPVGIINNQNGFLVLDVTNEYSIDKNYTGRIVDSSGKVLTTNVKINPSHNYEQEKIFVVNNKYGLLNKNNQLIIPVEYDKLNYLGTLTIWGH